MSSNGLTAKNWNTKKGAELRRIARGHSTTPERPERAEKNPEKYKEYIERRKAEIDAVDARKVLLFSDKIKYNAKRSINNVKVNPKWETGNATSKRPRSKYMKRFLSMSYDDVLAVDWSDDDWGFLFYH